MTAMWRRLRRFLRTRRGRQVQHDALMAAAAAAAVVFHAHSVALDVIEGAAVIGLKTFLRLVLPVPAADGSGSERRHRRRPGRR